MLTLLRSKNGKLYYITDSKKDIMIKCTRDELNRLKDDIEKSFSRWD